MVIWTWSKLQIESSGVKFSYVNRSEKKLHGPFIYIRQCHLAISDLLGPLAPPRAPKVEKTPQNGTYQLKTAISRSFLADLIKFVWIQQRNRHLAHFSRPFQHSFAKTLRPSSGKNKRFWITDPRSAQKNGRFDILTSKTKKIFEIMVIWTWSKLQIGYLLHSHFGTSTFGTFVFGFEPPPNYQNFGHTKRIFIEQQMP